jgi:quinone-modifying oxidoreductase, subunit QmoC
VVKGTKRQRLPDYGWRFRGQRVGFLKDRSFTLDPTRQLALAIVVSSYCSDGASLASCLQCGMCTASCNIAEEGSLFPRRQMTLLQLGQKESLVADPNIWLCFNCTDCSSRCPANARPGRVMAAIRRMVVEHYAVPRFMGRLVNAPKSFPLVVLVPALLLLATIAIGGSFTPPRSPLRYASMLPHLTLNLVFLAVSGLAAMGALWGAARAWSAFAGEPVWRVDLRRLIPALASAGREILAHRRFSECMQFPSSRWAHVAVFYGFLSLLLLAGLVATLTPLGLPYPFPLLHPLKIAGNLAAVLLILGSAYFLDQRRRASASRGDPSSWYDWALLLELLLVSVTGVLTELFRYTDSAALAYPTYFVHLVLAFTLLVSLPYSKFAHVVYRTLALTAREYRGLCEVARAGLENRRVAV